MISFKTKTFVFFSLLFYTFISKEINHRPIIGILTLPYHGNTRSYVEDSYVRMIESSGARAVPIRWNSSRRIIDFILNSVNGVLIQGNHYTNLVQNPRSLFAFRKKHFKRIDETSFYILTKAFEFNKKGIHFPVWLDNYGFQFLITNFSKNKSILSNVGLESYSSSLYLNDMEMDKNDIFELISKNKTLISELTENIKNKKQTNFNNVLKYKMFKGFEIKELNRITTKKTMFFNTKTSVLLKDFVQSQELMKHIFPTSFVLDKNGNLTVSSFEFKNFPFYGTNFEVDKLAYTLINHDHILHSHSNIQINRKFSDFFIEECKRNYQKFTDKRSEINMIFEAYKIHYDHRMKRFIYIIRPGDDENDDVSFD